MAPPNHLNNEGGKADAQGCRESREKDLQTAGFAPLLGPLGANGYLVESEGGPGGRREARAAGELEGAAGPVRHLRGDDHRLRLRHPHQPPLYRAHSAAWVTGEIERGEEATDMEGWTANPSKPKLNVASAKKRRSQRAEARKRAKEEKPPRKTTGAVAESTFSKAATRSRPEPTRMPGCSSPRQSDWEEGVARRCEPEPCSAPGPPP